MTVTLHTGEPAVNRAWGAIRALLERTFPFYDIKGVVALAGLDPTELAHLEQKSGSGGELLN
jgi:hypothetical protein